ncbi:MAG: hypothetical protein ACKN9U_12380, partial [Pirellulaceae bacterium]
MAGISREDQAYTKVWSASIARLRDSIMIPADRQWNWCEKSLVPRAMGPNEKCLAEAARPWNSRG